MHTLLVVSRRAPPPSRVLKLNQTRLSSKQRAPQQHVHFAAAAAAAVLVAAAAIAAVVDERENHNFPSCAICQGSTRLVIAAVLRHFAQQ